MKNFLNKELITDIPYNNLSFGVALHSNNPNDNQNNFCERTTDLFIHLQCTISTVKSLFR